MGIVYFYTIIVAFALGIFVRSFFTLSYAPVLWLWLLAIALLVVRQRERSASSLPHLFTTSLFLIFIGLGIARFDLAERQLSDTQLRNQIGQTVQLTGVIDREPEQRANSLHVFVRTDDTTVLVLADRYANLQYGQRVRIEGTLKEPAAFETDFGRTFDYPGYLHAQGVTHTISYAAVEVLGNDAGSPVIAVLLWSKRKLIDSFSGVIHQPQSGLGAGLLLGVKQALGDQLEQAFRTVGIIHIVVLSGYNIMIVAEAVMRLLAIFFSVRVRAVIGALAISGFAIMVGLSATVLRASIMAVMVLLARATNRTYAVLRALLFAGAIMLLLNPYLLAFDPGFQLSFLATLGLILVAPHVERWLHFAPTRWQIREFITATLSTQLFVLPLLLYMIGEFSVVAVIVNVLVLPLVPLSMGLVFLTGMVGFISSAAAGIVGILASLTLSYIIGVAERFAALPFASFMVPPFPFWIVVAGYGVLGIIIYRLNHPPKREQSLVEGWTIVAETENGGERSSPPPETPVFFR